MVQWNCVVIGECTFARQCSTTPMQPKKDVLAKFAAMQCSLAMHGSYRRISGSQQEGEACLQALVCTTHIIVSDGVVEAGVGSPQPDGLLVIRPGCVLLTVKISNMYRLATCTSGCDSKLWHWHIQLYAWCSSHLS